MEGKSVDDILLDTGCSRTLVHKDLVPEGKIKEGEAVAIWRYSFVSIGPDFPGSGRATHCGGGCSVRHSASGSTTGYRYTRVI